MKATYGHSRADVIRWPDDPAARRVLEEYFDYLDKLPGGSRTIESLLDGFPWHPPRGSPRAELQRGR